MVSLSYEGAQEASTIGGNFIAGVVNSSLAYFFFYSGKPSKNFQFSIFNFQFVFSFIFCGQLFVFGAAFEQYQKGNSAGVGGDHFFSSALIKTDPPFLSFYFGWYDYCSGIFLPQTLIFC